jgi:hypothetical protein
MLKVSSQSRKSNTTIDNKNAHTIYMDELGNQYTDKGDNGTGYTDIKEQLTSQELNSEHCYIDSDSKRIKMITRSQHYNTTVACTNAPRTAIPAPIVDRFYYHIVDFTHRQGFDAACENYHLKNDLKPIERINRLKRQWSLIQCLANFLLSMIRGGFIQHDINLSICSTVCRNIYSYLDDNNCNVHRRDRERIFLCSKNFVIYEAIKRVFFSDEFLPFGTAYKYEHLYLCLPLLFARREHIFKSFSLLHDMTVDPQLPFVINGIRHLITSQTVQNKFVKTGPHIIEPVAENIAISIQRKRDNKIDRLLLKELQTNICDYDYYAITIPKETNYYQIENLVFNKISLACSFIKTPVSIDNVTTVVRWLETQKMKIDKQLIETLKFSKSGDQMGFHISSDYMSSMCDMGETDVKLLKKLRAIVKDPYNIDTQSSSSSIKPDSNNSSYFKNGVDLIEGAMLNAMDKHMTIYTASSDGKSGVEAKKIMSGTTMRFNIPPEEMSTCGEEDSFPYLYKTVPIPPRKKRGTILERKPDARRYGDDILENEISVEEYSDKVISCVTNNIESETSKQWLKLSQCEANPVNENRIPRAVKGKYPHDFIEGYRNDRREKKNMNETKDSNNKENNQNKYDSSDMEEKKDNHRKKTGKRTKTSYMREDTEGE